TTPVPMFQQAAPSPPHVPMLSSTPAHNALSSHMAPPPVVSPMASAPTLPATSISAVPKSQATPTVVTSPPTPPAEAKRWIQQPTGLVLAIAVCVGFAFAVGAIALVQNLSPTSKEVVLDTSPQGALVVVNGQDLGVTPLTWSTDDEQLSVVFKLDGYKPFKAKAIDLTSQERRIFRSLEPLQMQLALTLPIQGARVKVGAIDMGSLPANRSRSITVNWPTTPLPIVIEHPDYAPLRYTITAPMARETMTLSFKTEDFVPR
ncbi:MAG: PEGA domain-containing protein, partial [Myxococcota bacterium]